MSDVARLPPLGYFLCQVTSGTFAYDRFGPRCQCSSEHRSEGVHRGLFPRMGWVLPPTPPSSFCELLRRVSIEHSDIERSLLHDSRESRLPEQSIRCCSEGLRIAGSSLEFLPANLCALGEFAKYFSQQHTAKVDDAAKSYSSSTISRSLEHMP